MQPFMSKYLEYQIDRTNVTLESTAEGAVIVLRNSNGEVMGSVPQSDESFDLLFNFFQSFDLIY